jgi:hypothetical protein
MAQIMEDRKENVRGPLRTAGSAGVKNYLYRLEQLLNQCLLNSRHRNAGYTKSINLTPNVFAVYF